MTHQVVREYVNGTFFLLNLCLIFVFLSFLGPRLRKPGWYYDFVNQACIAQITYLTGESLRSSWVWVSLFTYNNSGRTDLLEHFWGIAIVSVTVGSIGALCCIRVYSPARWGNRGWIACGVGTALIIWLSSFF